MSDPVHIAAGFLPLLDSAVLLTACEQGFAEEEGIALSLVRETSWANIRDRMSVEHFEVAHMLAPMPIASNLGITPLPFPMVAPMALGLGGNAITVSQELWGDMQAAGADSSVDPARNGAALKEVVAARRRASRPLLQLGVVHPHSGHNFDLRYWLAGCDIDPRKDVEIVMVPPPLMPDALARRRIDGFCVGEPWNSVAIAAGHGRIATVKSAIWKSSPEKVLGVSADWATEHPDDLSALLRALYRAAEWCSSADNLESLAEMLSRKAYLDIPRDTIARALTGKLCLGNNDVAEIDDFFLPFDRAATFPWRSHALWFYTQMVRWGQIEHTPANAAVAAASYRPDLYRSALSPLDAALPGASAKVEGALDTPAAVGATTGRLVLGPDGFFDGKIFDPERLNDYIEIQKAASESR